MTKERILDEIKRIALNNNGKPPGIGGFYNATGIKRSDWEGKFWVRWNEALEEAGFAPNQLSSSYEKDFLFEKLIGLAREQGIFQLRRS